MGNFEKLSVLVIVVIIVMILVVAIYTWTDNPDQSATTGPSGTETVERAEIGPFNDPKGTTPGEHSWERIFNDPPEKPFEPKPIPTVTPVPTPTPDPEPTPDPTPQPSEEAKPAEGPGENWKYTIKPGDTLSEIAMRELGTWRRQKEILKLNPGLDPNTLRVGQQITMPPKGAVAPNPPKDGEEGTPAAGGSSRPVPGEYYVTRSGDTLERISKKAYRTSNYWGEIWARNLSVLSAPEDVVPGMKLFIPKVTPFK